MTAPPIDEVIWLLDDVVKQRRKLRRLMAVPLIIAAVGLGVLFTGGDTDTDTARLGLATTLLGMMASCACAFALRAPLERLGEAWDRAGDVRHIGPLLEVSARHADLSEACQQALIRLLPQLRPRNQGLLSPAQQRLLCEAIARSARGGRPASVEFAVVALDALGRVGDEEAGGTVAALARAPARTSRQQRIREAALRCLPLLEARGEEARRTRTLLRASAAPANPPHEMLRAATATDRPSEMLRPAQGVHELPEAQLLRPGLEHG